MTFNIIWQSLSAQKQFLSLTFLEFDNRGTCSYNNLLCYYAKNDASMKVRGKRLEKNFQKQSFVDILQNSCS